MIRDETLPPCLSRFFANNGISTACLIRAAIIEGVASAIVLGRHKRAPTVDEVIRLLKDPVGECDCQLKSA